MVEVAVVPAAGHGRRMRPLTASVPKEMLPFGRWPLIEHTVSELADSGVAEICVVIRKGKEIIRDYLAGRAGRYAPARITFAYQEKASGLGGALRSARAFIRDRSFLMAIPDQLLLSGKPAVRQLLEAAGPTPGVWNTLVDIPEAQVAFFAGARGLRCQKDEAGKLKVEDILPGADTKVRGFGRTLFPPESLEFMSEDYRNQRTGEVDLLATFTALKRRFPLFGTLLEGAPCDLGSWEGYLYYQGRYGEAVTLPATAYEREEER